MKEDAKKDDVDDEKEIYKHNGMIVLLFFFFRLYLAHIYFWFMLSFPFLGSHSLTLAHSISVSWVSKREIYIWKFLHKKEIFLIQINYKCFKAFHILHLLHTAMLSVQNQQSEKDFNFIIFFLKVMKKKISYSINKLSIFG